MEQHRIKYTGPAPFASAVAHTLKQAGLEVTWTPPAERRGAYSVAEAVTVYYICKGGDVVINAAVEKARALVARRGARLEYEPRHRER